MPLVPSPAVVRAGDLLGYLASHPSRAYTVSELARTLDIPRATCNSVLLGLEVHGFVRRDAELRYELGSGCIAIGDAARVANPALRAAAVHAEALARAESAVVAVTMRDGDETRVAQVFDFGPPFGIRPRVGDSIRLVPPFGASFVAWDDQADIDNWLQRADLALASAQGRDDRTALDAVRRRGYSITVAHDDQGSLAAAFQRLASDEDLADNPDSRDRAIREIADGEFLAAAVDRGNPVRLTQISAPVFEPGGTVNTSIMLLGPGRPLAASEIERRGELVLAAATRATVETGGVPFVRER